MQKSENFSLVLNGDISHLKLSNDRKTLFYVYQTCQINIFCLKFFKIKKKITRYFFEYRLDMLKIVDYTLFTFNQSRFSVKENKKTEDTLIVVTKGIVYSRGFLDKKSGEEIVFNNANGKKK